ncbi:MAG: DUF4426 domain-containing protein [Gammaproteobacteria bacterium]
MKHFLLVLSFALVICCSASYAEQSSSFGDYVVHYNALTTDQILPSVARPYGILRSKNRALLNIAVQKKVMGTPVQAVEAELEVTATNLNAQLKTVEMRQITSSADEGTTAIYYIGELPVAHKETVKFNVHVKPAGDNSAHEFVFEQQFFTK